MPSLERWRRLSGRPGVSPKAAKGRGARQARGRGGGRKTAGGGGGGGGSSLDAYILDPMFANSEDGIVLDPSDLSTMWQDTGKTTPVAASGDPVRVWVDKMGSGREFVAPSDAARPIYQDGSAITDGSYQTPYLEFDGNKYMIYSGTDMNFATLSYWGRGTNSSINRVLMYWPHNTTNVSPFYRAGLFCDSNLRSETRIDGNLHRIAREVYGSQPITLTGVDPTTGNMWLADNNLFSTTGSTTSYPNNQGMILGADASFGGKWNGKVYGFVAVNRAMNEDLDIDRVFYWQNPHERLRFGANNIASVKRYVVTKPTGTAAAITNVISSINEIDYQLKNCAISTTSTRLAPYVTEGIKIPYTNRNNGDDIVDFRVPAKAASPGTGITEGGCTFYIYYDSNASNWQHNVFSLMAPDGTTPMIALRKSLNSTTLTWYHSDADTVPTQTAYGTAMTTGLHRIDVEWKIAADGTGYFNTWVDGVAKLAVTGQNNGRGASIAYFGGRYETGGTTDRVYSGIIFAEESVVDMTCVQQVPTGDGASAQFTGTYANVDSPGFDGMNPLLFSATNKTHLFTFPAIPTGPDAETPVGVVTRAAVWTEDLSLTGVIRSGGANYDQSSVASGATTVHRATFELSTSDPDTASQWDIAGIEAAQFGFKSAA